MRATGCAYLRRSPHHGASRFVSLFSRQLSSRGRFAPALIATHQAKVPSASSLLQAHGALRPFLGGAAPLDLSRGGGVRRLSRAAPAEAADEARAPASAADEARLFPRFLDALRHPRALPLFELRTFASRMTLAGEALPVAGAKVPSSNPKFGSLRLPRSRSRWWLLCSSTRRCT